MTTVKNKRKAISKKLRFEIFERDDFTCQYCGKTPPDVMLQVDHIIPVCKGGTNDPENLRTSCFECNIGKGGKLVGRTANGKDSRRRAQEALESVKTATAFTKSAKARTKLRASIKDHILSLVQDQDINQSNVTVVMNSIQEFGIDQSLIWLDKAAQVIQCRNSRVEEWSIMRYFMGIIKTERKNRE